MSSLVLIILSVSFFVSCTELPAGESNQNAREEKLRSALFNAFQSIKKASAKGGIDDESPLTSDLDMISTVDPTRSDKLLHVDKFDLSGDDGGLTFAEAFDTDERTEERKVSSTEKSHNVQHIVKTTVRVERTTGRPQGRDVLSKLSATIRSAVNESKGDARRESRDNGSEALGSEALGSDLSKEGLGGEVRGIEEVLRIFDAALLLRQWPRLQRALPAACRTDMELYVRALTRNTLWAYKMEDASGRYTTMFYWGNNYWTGSAELCRALNNHLPPSRLHNRSSGSQIFSAWREDVSMTGSGPPFETAFYTVRLLVSSDHPDIVKSRRTMHLGVCLPYSCGRAGVTTLVSAVQAPFLNHSVLGVRSPDHEEYSYMEDPTVHVLLAVASLVTILLIAATVYDFKLSQEVRRRRRRVVNMAASESGASDTKLDLNGLEAITVAKDKSMYNCNNNIANLSEERLTGETASTDEELKLSIWSELLLSFSVKANTLQIFDQSVGADTIPVVHGLRMMSMVWVIFGHTCIVMFKYADNTALRAILEKSFWFQLIISAVYSVDTFFCLGGMLVTFLYFRTSAKGKLDRLTKGRRKLTSGVLQFLGLMAYRFARLTAPYLFMLGVVQVTMKWFAVNSVFEPPANDYETCPQYWWRNLLYINTLFPVEQMCMLWSWYLSDDTQFYAVSAILLILATSHFKLSVSLTGVFFISSLFTTGYVSYSTEHIPNSEDPFTQFDKIYDKPWTRLGPYLVGMATGWILFKTNLKIRMPKMLAWLGWVVCTATFLFLIFGLYRTELGVGAAAVYSAVSHSLWAACVGWVIIACSTGHGGWVKHILSAPVLYPFSRVTYCTYLVHPVVLRYVAMHLTHPVHLAEILVFVLFLGLTVISYVIAFVVSLAFEAPMVSMLKILSPQRKPHRV